MKMLLIEDLQALSIGAAILGSGGGGGTSLPMRVTSHLLQQGREISLISVDELEDDDLVVPIGFMGSPLVALEKLPSGLEAQLLLEAIRKHYPGRRIVLLPAEIGGGNAFTPLWVAALHQLPVLDADSIGRAFPKLPMSVLNLHGISPSPVFLADSDGHSQLFFAENADEVEREARKICVSMGSCALAALYLMSGKVAQTRVIAGSISRAIAIGTNPRGHGRKLTSGIIDTIDYSMERGFLKGSVCLKEEDGGVVVVHFVNEYLAATREGLVIAQTPDIITLLDEQTSQTISTPELKWGLRVDLVALPAPAIWHTQQGLALVGLNQMGVDICSS